MRYRQAHAAKSGSVPFALRGPKSLRGALLAAVATAIGLAGAAPASADAVPTLTIEPPAGTLTEAATATFTVRASATSTVPITVNWKAVDVTPAAGHGAASMTADLTAPLSGTAVIAAGATTATIDIVTAADLLHEDPEDFAVEISDPTNATLGTPTRATATITDDDTAPTVAITPVAVSPEGSSGIRQQTFTATLSGVAGKTVKADWATAAGDTDNDPLTPPTYGDAVPGKDFVAGNGTLAFPAGTTTQTFTVGIIGDTIDEGPVPRVDATDGEVFDIVVSPVAGESPASVVGGSTTITITDDDAVPTVTFDNLTVPEGGDSAAVLLPIKLSNGSDHPIAFAIAENAGATTAVDDVAGVIGDNDYAPLSTAATIGPEMTTGYAAVLVNGDATNEPDETVGLEATADPAAVSATFVTQAAADPGTLTLKNDDKAPDLEINSDRGQEGDTVDVIGTVTGISQTGANLTLTFTGAAADGHRAASGSDFTAPSSTTVSIPAGTLPGTELPVTALQLRLYDDTEPEPAESIVVAGSGTGGTVTDGVVVIDANDDYQPPKPTISASSTRIDGPGSVRISGKVGAGETVQLWGAAVTATAQPLKQLATATADSTGAYTFTRTISTGWRFQTKSQEGATSNEVTVRVMQDPAFTATSGSKGKLSLRVTGDPKLRGAAVQIQRYSGGKWSNTSWRGTTNSSGVWSSTVSAKAGSSWTLRARVGGNSSVAVDAGYSATRKVTVKK
ncbi:Calx-beta domain-containing protein [Actinoplanes flavus]|uniref:Calx-beta domain-containing protein n=1 Tax=Actinoplanes flavus TaxID=2820290 RepID=A0ABS3UW51_9ACTN|nr:Calx-beta domain-containing protein [Actinoplanes flavus]MBO3742795.1 hypothetical protein [Actinoplanes flavus]